MKIGVISDTHIPFRMQRLPKQVFKIFNQVGLILHAGDLESKEVINQLAEIAPVEAVKGNMDQHVSGTLPKRKVVEAAGIKIGLIHGDGGPRENIRERIRHHFKQVQVIVYGHSHQAFWEKQAGIWFMNPGSAITAGYGSQASVGRLTLSDEGAVKGEIIRL